MRSERVGLLERAARRHRMTRSLRRPVARLEAIDDEVAGGVGAAVIARRYVVPQVVRPIERITSAMSELASGDTSIDVPGRDRSDEIGRMAEALGIFRDTAIELQRSTPSCPRSRTTWNGSNRCSGKFTRAAADYLSL